MQIEKNLKEIGQAIYSHSNWSSSYPTKHTLSCYFHFKDERTQVLSELHETETLHSNLKSDLARYRECDPEVLEEVKQQTTVAREAVNRWTDNIFSIKSWCRKKFNIEESMINKNFGIPEELDYLE